MTGHTRLKVLSFTTLFPNRARPGHGLFVRNRLERIARYCDLEVVAPINVLDNPRLLWRVPRRDIVSGLRTHHPRFAVLPGLLKHLDGALLYRQAAAQVRRAVPLGGYDLLDVHYAYPDGVAGQLLALEMRRPFVISLRGSDIYVLARFPRRRRLIQELLARAAAVITVSRALGREAEALGASGSKVVVIPNGVDRAVFFPRDRQAARRALGWPADARVVLAVGRLAPVKGLDLLVRAVRRVLAERRLPVRCYVVGDGPSRPALAREIRGAGLEGTVVLAGAVPQAALPVWYSAADLLCLPSHSEGCPNVLLESLACGTPVVATAVGGVAEVIEEGVTGLLVRQRCEGETAGALAEGLERAWSRAAITRSPVVRDWSETAALQAALFGRVAGAS